MDDAMERQLRELQSRVERLEAVEAARAVVMAYGHAVDAGDEAWLAEVYADDAVLIRTGAFEGVGERTGWDEISAALRAATGFRQNDGRHFIMTTCCEHVEPDLVTFRSHFVALKQHGGVCDLYWGDYIDTVAKRGEVWRLARKETRAAQKVSFSLPVAEPSDGAAGRQPV